jgi:hypothetical protein
MKKTILAFIVAGFLVSCDNAADAEKRAKDSLDSVTKLQKESIDEAAQDAKQNVEQANDSLKEKLDSSTMGKDTSNRAQ